MTLILSSQGGGHLPPGKESTAARRAASRSPSLGQGLTFYFLGGGEVFRVMSERSQVVAVGRSLETGHWLFVIWCLSPFR